MSPVGTHPNVAGAPGRVRTWGLTGRVVAVSAGPLLRPSLSGHEGSAATVARCLRPSMTFVSEQRRMRKGEFIAGERLSRKAGEPFRPGPHLLG